MECVATLITVGVLAIIGLCVAGGWRFQSKSAVQTNLKGAELAIQTLGDWSKWMAGIETAGIAGLAYLSFSPTNHEPLPLSPLPLFFAILALVMLGLSLLSVAWILSSLSSFSLRIYSKDPRWVGKFDIHEEQMFARGGPRLSFVVTTHHWFWGCGLVAVGGLIIARVASA